MRSFLSMTLAVGVAAFIAGPAGAENLRDRVYADSFGNLVIHSSAGYKRIIVGQGDIAESYNLTGSYYEPEERRVVYLDPPREERCFRPPYRWEGRSQMYGLPAHVPLQAPLVCE